MSANFFIKKCCTWLVTLFAFGVTIGSFAYAGQLSCVETVALDNNFYYLVSEDMQMEAGAEFIKLDGGAGYLLDMDGEEWVAMSVYLKEMDGVSVLNNLRKTGKTGKILAVKADRLYLKTKTQQKNALKYKGAFDSLYGCMQVLENCVFSLDKGMTQESCKRLLNALKRQFSYLKKEYQTEFSACSMLCKSAEEALTEMLSNTVYLRDLRYLSCQLAEGYVVLANEFSL